MPIVGTAGHVDHGKSTLVHALTGRDPDRLAEEKRRGLTIDLGFAWTTLPSGTEVGFVDVPGHEKFIKNMLAGIEAVNVGLLVVAADEGWMPQSEEHLAVLDLLELPAVVIALTRVDRCDAETREMAAAEVEEQVAGTVAEGAPIIEVDSVGGTGVADVAAALDDAIAATTVRNRERPRLWVDRAFVIAGAGTVVTGTMLDGTFATGDEVAVFPGATSARIRGMQSHERDVDAAVPGNRTALNLSGLESGGVPRGAMIGRHAEWVPSGRFVVALRTVRSLVEPLRDRGAFHLHLGSGAWPARLRLLGEKELSGQGFALITTGEPLPITMGDRFILREVGRRAVVGGGRVIEPSPPSRVARLDLAMLAATLGEEPDAQADALLRSRTRAVTATLAAHANGGTPRQGLVVAGEAFSKAEASRLTGLAMSEVKSFHDTNPLRRGMPKATLASRLGVGLAPLDRLIEGVLTDLGSEVADVGFSASLDPRQAEDWKRVREALSADLAVPRLPDLGLDTELTHALERDGSLVRVSADLVFLTEQIEEIIEGLQSLPDGFTVAQFRDHFGLTRKYAVPLLEWMDANGHTIRRGDGRVVR